MPNKRKLLTLQSLNGLEKFWENQNHVTMRIWTFINSENMDIVDGARVATIDNFKIKFHVLSSFVAWEQKPEIVVKVFKL